MVTAPRNDQPFGRERGRRVAIATGPVRQLAGDHRPGHRREADPVAERRAAGRPGGDLIGSTCPLQRPLSIGSALTVHREWSSSRTSVLTPPNRIKHDAGGRDRIAALHREPQSATSKGTSCGSLPCPMYRRNSIAFPGRPAYVGGSSRAAGHFAARPAADGEAQRRYSTRRDGGPREPGESRSGSAGVTNQADSGGSGRASGTAGSRAHTRRARARPRRQFPARSPHRIVEPAAGAGGVDGGLRGDECPQPLGLGAPTRQLVSLRWSHGGRDTPSAPAPLGRVDPRRTPAAVSGTGPAAQASATPPQPFLGERGAACRRPARRGCSLRSSTGLRRGYRAKSAISLAFSHATSSLHLPGESCARRGALEPMRLTAARVLLAGIAAAATQNGRDAHLVVQPRAPARWPSWIRRRGGWPARRAGPTR